MGEAKRRKAAGLYPSQGSAIVPDDLRADFAKSVQSIEFKFVHELGGGACFFRSIIGHQLLTRLKLQPDLALGGMVYRVGPDLRRDVVAFCGEYNAGQLVNGRFVGHYWLELGDDSIDFSVAEWRGLNLPDVVPCDLGAIQWTIEPPAFFWADKKSLAPVPGQSTPDLGKAWYTGWNGPQPPRLQQPIDDVRRSLNWTAINRHFDKCCEIYALSERSWAARQGHTAVRLSHLCRIAGLPTIPVDRGDRCIVLRGKPEITPQYAAEVVAEACQQ